MVDRNVDRSIRDALNWMAANLSYDRLAHIVYLVQRTVANATPGDVARFIDGDGTMWEEPEGHQRWLDTATDDEIASWVVDGMS